MTKLNTMWVLFATTLLGALFFAACSATDDSGLFNTVGEGGEGGQSAEGGSGAGWIAGGTGGDGGEGGGIIGQGVTLSGRVMAPSGAFPISGALVYVTAEAPAAIPSGVYHYECDQMLGTPYTLSKADGSWSIPNITVGTWNLVTRKGNFRRVREITVSAEMDPNIPEELTTLPGKPTPDGLDTIPSMAVVKTSPDLTYNLLAKFGLGQVDAFGDLIPGTESFHIYQDSGFGSYAHTKALFDSESVLHSYQMIFLPCNASSVGVSFVNNHVQMLRDYVAAGGRIYNSCTVSLWTEAAFPDYIDFYGSQAPTVFDIGRRTSSAYKTHGTVLDQNLADWLKVVTPHDPNQVPFHNGYVTIDATQEVADGHGLEEDDFVVKPYTWVKDSDSYPGSPLMVTYNFDHGKVFYSVYETSSTNKAVTAQEYVLLYVILEVGVCTNLPPEVK